MKVPDGLDDEQVLFLSDIFPTGYMAAENAGIEPGDTVAVWGCGPVGQFAIRSAFMLGAAQVIAIDRHERALRWRGGPAQSRSTMRAPTISSRRSRISPAAGAGAVHRGRRYGSAWHVDLWKDRACKAGAQARTGNATALRQIFQACGKGGTVSVVACTLATSTSFRRDNLRERTDPQGRPVQHAEVHEAVA